MKKSTLILIALLTTILISCSGSDVYRGKWKATNKSGEKFEIVFKEKEFAITNNGETKSFEYKQMSINIENSVETYGIKLEDGRSLHIQFPIGSTETKGAILDANKRPVYIIDRNNYIGYKDVYGL